MTWSSPDSIVSRLLSGDLLSILIALVVSICVPILVHLALYSGSSKPRTTPSFLLLGTVGAGKTSLLTVLQKHHASITESHKHNQNNTKPSLTRTSQISHKATVSLPPTIRLGSNKYRSENDTSNRNATTYHYQVIDTPGHGKLRAEQALPHLDEPSLSGIIYVVDAAALDVGDDPGPLKETSTYLHDVLLHLQRRKTGKGGGSSHASASGSTSSSSSSSKRRTNVAVMIAANKQDLFQALPPGAVRERLETGIERARRSKTNRLGDVGESREEQGQEDEDDGLLASDGGAVDGRFTFRRFSDEYGISVEVVGGAVRSGEEEEEGGGGGKERERERERGTSRGIEKWERWIGERL